jgi:hypothetical protein
MTITTGNRSLLTILLSALVQGWALYGLHHGLTNHHWPAPNVPLTIGLYTCVVLIPLTVQLLAEHAQRKVLWLLIVPAEVHLFAKGGHAFALRSKAHPVAGWPLLVENWLKDMGVLPR